MTSIKPLKDYTLVRLADKTNKTEGGIITTTERRPQHSTIIAVGPDVTEVSVDDVVMFQHGDFKPVKLPQMPAGDYALIKEEHIIGVFE